MGILFPYLISFSQTNTPDDLEKIKLRAEQNYYAQPDSTYILADSLISVSTQLGKNVYVGEGLRLKGVYHQLRAELDTAFSYFQQAGEIFRSLNDSTRLPRALLSEALMDISLGRYAVALEKCMEAKSISELVKLEPFRLRAIAEIARIYSFQGNHAKALEECQYYYSQVKNSEDLNQLATSLSYLSVEFMHLKVHDSSLYYLEKNLAVQSELRNPVGVGAALQNMASVYLEMKDTIASNQKFRESLVEYRKVGFGQGIAQVQLNIASSLARAGKYREAVPVIEEGVVYAKPLGDLRLLRAQYQLQSEVYEKTGSFRKALMAHKNYAALNDSLSNADKQRTINELLTKYETQEKEQRIEVQNERLDKQEAELQRKQVIIVGLIVLSVMVVLLIRIRASKKQALIQKEGELKLREAEINAVINSQEKERNRFARDLHDGFGQLISVLKLNLSQLNEVTNKDVEKRDEIFKNGESVINEMYSELRNICFDLMPQTLVKRGITSALKEFGSRINQNTKVNCEVLVFDNNERLPELVEISLFRITQEWVNNVLKYAGADTITIQLTREDGEATLTIEDNGTGFDSQDFYKGKGNGWRNIQTRLNQVGGEFDLDTRQGVKGSMVTVNVYLKEGIIPIGTDMEMTGS